MPAVADGESSWPPAPGVELTELPPGTLQYSVERPTDGAWSYRIAAVARDGRTLALSRVFSDRELTGFVDRASIECQLPEGLGAVVVLDLGPLFHRGFQEQIQVNRGERVGIAHTSVMTDERCSSSRRGYFSAL